MFQNNLMSRLLMVLCMSAALTATSHVSFADDNVRAGACSGRDIDSDDAAVWIDINRSGGLTLFDNGQTVAVTLYTCQSKTASDCDEFWWDHDGNGTKTQQQLDGDGAAFTRGVSMPSVPIVRAVVNTAPASDDIAVLLFCPKNT